MVFPGSGGGGELEEPGCPVGMGNWGAAGLLAPRVLKAGGEFWGGTRLRRPW